MVQLHEKTQRRIGLIGFGLLCVAPTVAVLVWACSLHLPSHRRGIEQRLSHLLGMEVRIDAVRHPKPGVTVLEDLEIRTAEGGETILKSKAVDAYFQWNGKIVITSPRVSVDAKHYDVVEELFARILSRKVKPDTFHVRVNVAALNVRLSESKVNRLTDVRGILSSEPEQSETHWNFQLADNSDKEPLRVSFRRERKDQPAMTVLGVHTGDGAISSELLALGLPWMRYFGGATFHGTIQTEGRDAGEETQLCGEWHDLDVETLVHDREMAGISGLADLTVSYARFHNGRLAEATGVLHAGPGSAERRFVEAMALSYDLNWSSEATVATGRVPYTWLEADFRLENGLFVIKGRSGDVVMQGPHGESLLTSRNQPLALDAFRFPGLVIGVVEVESMARR